MLFFLMFMRSTKDELQLNRVCDGQAGFSLNTSNHTVEDPREDPFVKKATIDANMMNDDFNTCHEETILIYSQGR